CQHSFRTPYSF
nr:immunoglobulin light chain junction region [Macaca mulatta]MOV78470.1 immunoglobulin light chain junction region [Macaca mulatta]MOV78490.1 immunoglobulin light chain junction region [Macaca mulatta]MOV79345.1 immunoglobulin light chain junction region [Macaca mulatta]MOV79396.1 immunoglobulin light chain junction region [Macaca mulatta]